MASTDAGGITLQPGRYTWTCFDCPCWAEQYWDTLPEAQHDAHQRQPAHRDECPGEARLIALSSPIPEHPDQLGVEHHIGTYDPNEPMLVPYWAVLLTRSLVISFANHADRGQAIDLANPRDIQLWASWILASDPLPGTDLPTDADALAVLLHRTADALGDALPRP
ncbi:MAG: hypothetical protein JXA67_12080 [Micromonosporaceae bacterium]|nr:hypothetical protein [Micromonosporaceae bacterium]